MNDTKYMQFVTFHFCKIYPQVQSSVSSLNLLFLCYRKGKRVQILANHSSKCSIHVRRDRSNERWESYCKYVKMQRIGSNRNKYDGTKSTTRYEDEC